MTSTEETNPHSKEIDALPIQEIIRIMNEENLLVTEAVRAASDSISMAVRDAVNAIRSGGRLIYIGAGTSGRLWALDASEIPLTLAALKEAKRRGAKCWLLTCNDIAYDFLDGIIKLLAGPEIIAGSTRLKAGTATKIVLNMISTAAMIQLGKVYKDYMVDVVPSNKNVRRRGGRIIREVTECGLAGE